MQKRSKTVNNIIQHNKQPEAVLKRNLREGHCSSQTMPTWNRNGKRCFHEKKENKTCKFKHPLKSVNNINKYIL